MGLHERCDFFGNAAWLDGAGLDGGRGKKEDELSADGCACGQLGAQFADGAAEELFVELGELACEGDGLGWAEGGFDVGEGVEDAMGGFVEDVGCVAARDLFECRFALACFGGEEAVEGEALGREAAGDECADGGVGTGDGEDVDAGGDGGCGDLSAGVGDAWGAGVADYRDFCALFEIVR